ncbi:endolytic transglycosylase MltG [cf. Phormidesmis sp. LEGE 11477]|uniref:endolytic transglycosylase MltG n=1 Tax=cf. Phormidesmis sp. LEGE 11477 TaxID=1828680 RepID=UPI00187EE875|nr:endolytic transglycosylase MltG [cf. Phormidesmis sp. LEGE 11477]MBE9062744.1 endolytic transglycosylase MltG [cf. Phormidesmis sp. LEGE 11477]
MPGLKRLFPIVLVALAAGAASQSWVWWSWAKSPVLEAEGEAAENSFVQVQIPPGTASNQIGQDLEAAGLIKSTTAWKLLSRWKSFRGGDIGGFQAGSYVISPTQSLDDIASTIWDGDVVQVSFTIPEGWRRSQMAERLEARGFTTAEEFMAATKDIPYEKYPWLPDGIPHLEGFLYPDTYQIGSDIITAESLRDVMLTQFEAVALPIYDSEPSDYSLLDWVTLASIVEKESVVADERDQIASVFARRLEEGMTLGSDPTVEYAFDIIQTPEQPLTYAQVETPHPYNTYINPGLTPTPIASPGAASLEASLDPAPTDFLFFVARYDGTHVFSRSFDEHLRAQAQIRDQVDASTDADID